ncbi:MAG: DNA repair protein RadC [Myxococcales bacterium]|jgi:DNA repair protein RadC|nr:DNA repair protein RadC [Myxococcales bacterium]
MQRAAAGATTAAMAHRRPHSIKQWPAHERPREKMRDGGAERLSEAELLAVLFPTAARGATDAVDQARLWLERCGSLRGLVDAPARVLLATPGIGAARAAMVQALGELARRYGQQRLARGTPLRTSAEVYRHCGERLAALRKEQFHVILLDGKNRPLKAVRVSEGTLTASLVHPREVFVPVIEESAAAIILVHNHPSGDPTPSAEDIAITRRLREVGELMGVRVLDHVIIGHGRYVSFTDEGL